MLKKLSLRKSILIIVPLLIIVVVVVTVLPKNRNGAYTLDKVQRRDISETISESGNVEIRGRTSVMSPTRGVIEEIYVSNGDIVGIGNKLFKVRSVATEDEKATAYASYLAAQSSLKEAEQSKLNTQSMLEQARKSMLDTGDILRQMNDLIIQGEKNPATGKKFTKEEITGTESAYKSAAYSYHMLEKRYVDSDLLIDSANAGLRSALLNYGSTQTRIVMSPSIGTISNLSVSVGDSVDVDTGVNIPTLSTPVNPVLTIANFSTISVSLDVDESDVTKLKIGQSATVKPDVVAKTYNAVITRIDDIGATAGNGGVVHYKVYLDIEDWDEQLKSGMTVDVDIITKEEKDVLSVQNEAVKPYQGGRAVRVLSSNGEIEFVPVEIGIRGRNFTQILNGISEGDEIIVSTSSEERQSDSPFGF